MNPRILIIIPSLKGGGAERVVVDLANYWVADKYEVHIIVLNKLEIGFELNSGIILHSANIEKISLSTLYISKIIKKINPEIIWVHMFPMTVIGILGWIISRSKAKIFITEHTHLSVSLFDELKLSRFWVRIAIKIFYSRVNGITGVSKGVIEDLKKIENIHNAKYIVINNPISLKITELGSNNVPKIEDLWGNSGFRILSIGALKHAKNHEFLIRAFYKFRSRYNSKLIILGEGEMRAELEVLVSQLGLKEAVSLPGFQSNTVPWLSSCDLFVLSSVREGFGTVLAEALFHGVSIVANDCPSGPREILNDGEYGRLVSVGDMDEFVSAIENTLNSPYDEDKLKMRAADFDISDISNQYLKLFFHNDERM